MMKDALAGFRCTDFSWVFAGPYCGQLLGDLGMKTEQAHEIITRLVAISDVVLENFSARGMKALGFDYDRLREINPRIVYCSMAGFGHRGPYKNYVAYGPMQESQAGIVNLTGWPDGQPSRVWT